MLTVQEDLVLKRVLEEGLLPGKNKLHEYMDWFSYHGICDLHSANVPDMMHTLYKGLSVKNLELVACLIYFLNDKSEDCLGMLDGRLKCVPYQQSVNPFNKKSKFTEGICFMFVM